MAKHTPTPWVPCGWSIDGDDGTCICEGFQDDEYEWDAPNRARIVAAVNAFHSQDGRELPTEKIEPGLFWEMRDLLESALQIRAFAAEAATQPYETGTGRAAEREADAIESETRALLAKLED